MRLWFVKGVWASKKARQAIAAMNPESIMSIAVIRHAALGDMVLARCFLVELRKHFPRAKITLSLISNYTRGAPEDLVDSVHIAIGRDKRDVPWREQLKKLKELAYHDIIFDLAATSRSFVLCLLTPAKLKIGYPYHVLHRYLFYDLAIARSDLEFEAVNMLKMLNVLGFATDYPPKFAMPGEPLRKARPYIVYFTSASTEHKCWPANHFSQLLAKMAECFPGHEHLVLRGIEDWESIDRILTPLSELKNVSAVDADSVEKTVSLIKGGKLLISNDTGIRHLAIASEIPTVGIFFSTDIFRYWPRYEGHEVVFNGDGSTPDVGNVFAAAKKQLSDK